MIVTYNQSDNTNQKKRKHINDACTAIAKTKSFRDANESIIGTAAGSRLIAPNSGRNGTQYKPAESRSLHTISADR